MINIMKQLKKMIVMSLSILLLSISTMALAEGIVLLKSGAFIEGCIESCATGSKTTQQCQNLCGCMIDEINKKGMASEYLFPFRGHSPDFEKHNQETLTTCASKVLK